MSGLASLFGQMFTTGSQNQAAPVRPLPRFVYVWPILGAAAIACVGFWVSTSVNQVLRASCVRELKSYLDSDVEKLRLWLQSHSDRAAELAESADWQQKLLPKLARPVGPADAMASEAVAGSSLRESLSRILERYEYAGYLLLSPDGVVRDAESDIPVGQTLSGYPAEFLQRVLAGQLTVSKPFSSEILLPGPNGGPRLNHPVMLVAVPVRDGAEVCGALAFRLAPEQGFSRLLAEAHASDAGETSVFDRNGVLLSNSRFDEGLKMIGLLPDRPDARSILNIEMRDPGVDLRAEVRSPVRRSEQPLTRMAESAVRGESGIDINGYRDYRGIPVIGAWTWLPEYDFGVATEIPIDVAFLPLQVVENVHRSLMTLLCVAAIGVFAFMMHLERQQRRLQHAVVAARQLGQYTLEEKLGAGGMGTVYLARHAFLRRATAVKFLDVDKGSPHAIARFEREVQLTAQLTHPNTIAIYDFGRTPEGIFYYAMEYLDGINLEQLVRREGCIGEARLMHIMRQVCSSLAEAHSLGLIHRDIKPANIFLTKRGGLVDFVKVLDFGLVKAIQDREGDVRLDSDNGLAGTPLYMSPEAIRQPQFVDARADVYSLGAVAYFLLTGTPVFSGDGVHKICMAHVLSTPEPPSVRSGRTVTHELELLILRCLAKNPDERPRDAASLLHEIDRCRLHEGASQAQDAALFEVSPDRFEPVASVTELERLLDEVVNLGQTVVGFESLYQNVGAFEEFFAQPDELAELQTLAYAPGARPDQSVESRN